MKLKIALRLPQGCCSRCAFLIDAVLGRPWWHSRLALLFVMLALGSPSVATRLIEG